MITVVLNLNFLHRWNDIKLKVANYIYHKIISRASNRLPFRVIPNWMQKNMPNE